MENKAEEIKYAIKEAIQVLESIDNGTFPVASCLRRLREIDNFPPLPQEPNKGQQGKLPTDEEIRKMASDWNFDGAKDFDNARTGYIAGAKNIRDKYAQLSQQPEVRMPSEEEIEKAGMVDLPPYYAHPDGSPDVMDGKRRAFYRGIYWLKQYLQNQNG